MDLHPDCRGSSIKVIRKVQELLGLCTWAVQPRRMVMWCQSIAASTLARSLASPACTAKHTRVWRSATVAKTMKLGGPERQSVPQFSSETSCRDADVRFTWPPYIKSSTTWTNTPHIHHAWLTWIPVIRHRVLDSKVPQDGTALWQAEAIIILQSSPRGSQLSEPVLLVNVCTDLLHGSLGAECQCRQQR